MIHLRQRVTIYHMNSEILHLIEQIHASDGKITLACTGAGTQTIAWLMSVAGASNTVLEAIVPYSKKAFDRWLEVEPEKYVAKKTALRLAGRMQVRAQLLEHSGEKLVGCACTGAIATNRPKKGSHRAYIATWTTEKVAVWYVELTKNARTREEEEQLVSTLLLNAISTALEMEKIVSLDLLPTDKLDKTEYDLVSVVDALYAEEIPYFGVYDFGRIATTSVSPEVIFPGSFNPLHKGHLAIYNTATRFIGKPLAFELSIHNVDKPQLKTDDAMRRMAQFAGRYPIYLTNAPTFLEKARIFNGTTFIIGYDTAIRIVQPQYYHDSIAEMESALREMRELGCRFVVAGRTVDDQFLTSDNLQMSAEFRPMFTHLPNFRADISSTELRAANLAGDR